MEQIRVVIVGGVHHNTLGVIRALGESGITKANLYLVIVSKDNDFCRYSRYIKK